MVHQDPALQPAVAAFERRALLTRLGETLWEVGDIPYEGRYKAAEPSLMSLSQYVAEVVDGCASGRRSVTDILMGEAVGIAAGCARYVFAEGFSRRGRNIPVKSER